MGPKVQAEALPSERTGMCVSGAGVQQGRTLTFGQNVDGWEFTKYHHAGFGFLCEIGGENPC